ncbi:MAG: enoyl-CoA hydratase/isomerase family protein [Myxococcales bacterium]|nr:enoyl-CoA hydratase/isomerase family protein [Myxococcales bacterium]
MNYEQIALSHDGPISELVLSRPEVRNAMSERMGREIADAVDKLGERRETRVLLVRGAGKAFAAGGDFKYIEQRAADAPERNRQLMMRFYRLFLAIRELGVPSIAVINGAAVGAGLCFAAACDIRLAARGAKLGANFVRIGLHPGMAATYLLPRIVGPAKASELLLTGKMIDADEAARIGLVNAVHEPDQLDGAAREMAQQIASASPLAVARTKHTLLGTLERSLSATLEREAYAQSLDYNGEDLAEGIRAFNEKREPRFS